MTVRIANDPPRTRYTDTWVRSLPTKPRHLDCMCPGCYFVATEGEMCLRCTLEGCDHENTRHG